MPEVEVDSGLIIKQQTLKSEAGVGFEKKMRIGIVIPVLNNFEGCVDLLQSIRSKHIISVYVMPQYRHQVALAAAWNHGAKRAFAEGCDYAIIANDDIIFAPETIDNFVSEFERLSPDCVLLSGSNIMGQLSSKWEILDHYNHDDPSTADHPDFSCFMIGRDFFEQMGTFDENFYPAWCEDQDMHQRIYLAGKQALVSTACPIAHIGSVTTGKLVNVDSSNSNNHFVKKWGSHLSHIPQTYTHPYNDESKTWKDW